MAKGRPGEKGPQRGVAGQVRAGVRMVISVSTALMAVSGFRGGGAERSAPAAALSARDESVERDPAVSEIHRSARSPAPICAAGAGDPLVCLKWARCTEICARRRRKLVTSTVANLIGGKQRP